MELRELRPGLWRWVLFHPEWKEDVGSIAYEAPNDLVLIDPIVLEDDALDDLVRRVAKPVSILVTIYYHTRSAGALARRHDARVLAARRARAAVGRRAGAVETFEPGDELTGGIRGLPTARSSEVVYWIPEHRALVPGDVILGGKSGRGLRLCPQSWLPGTVKLPDLVASLRPALELPVARVLVSHGEPVLRGGRAALAHALGA
jgi:glyoxylase-like metal-dependent hydrolase (beta-lactamase superfamily II)